MAARVSLAELASAGVLLHSTEAAAIVVEVCRQYSRDLVRGIPSAHVIRLTPEGGVVAEGPITTDHPPLAKAAQLLHDLLPPFGAPPAYRVPGGLRLIVARALGTLDLPPFESLDDFSSAVARFAAEDLASTARNLYKAWESARLPRALTVSDLRRARRATGLSLEDISSASGISSALLRELEWGYLKRWRNDPVGRSWLSGYAKACGLDEQLVTSIVVPMIEEEETDPPEGNAAEMALVPAGSYALVPSGIVTTPRSRRARSILWALAAAVVITLIALIATLERPKTSIQARAVSFRDFVPEFINTDAPLVRMDTPLATHLRYAAQTGPVAPVRLSRARAPVKRASGAAPPTRRPRSAFFKRHVLRIIIK